MTESEVLHTPMKEMSRKRLQPISSLATKWSEDESFRKKDY